MFWGGKSQGQSAILITSHHIRCARCQHDSSLPVLTLAPGFLHCTITRSLLLSLACSVQGAAVQGPHTPGWAGRLRFPHSRECALVIWDVSAWEMCFFSHFIFIHSFLFVNRDSWIFIVRSGLQSTTTLFCCSDGSNFGRWGLFHLALVYPVSSSWWFLALISWHHKMLQTVSVCFLPRPRKSHFSKELSCCYWRIVL